MPETIHTLCVKNAHSQILIIAKNNMSTTFLHSLKDLVEDSLMMMNNNSDTTNLTHKSDHDRGNNLLSDPASSAYAVPVQVYLYLSRI